MIFNLESYWKNIRDKLIVHALWTIIVLSVVSIGTYFISRKFRFTNLEIGLAILLVIVVIAIGSYVIYRRNNKRLPLYDPLVCDFHMLKEERVHKWNDDNSYVHKRRYKLKALKNGLTYYPDKFHWTGTEFTLSGGNSDYSIEAESESKNIYNVYRFNFTTPLKKDDIIEVEAKWIAKGPAKPFFSTTIEEPTDLLILSVVLYPGCGITQVNCHTEGYKGAKTAIDSQKAYLNSDGEFSWPIKNPKLLYHYEINWKL